MSNIRKGALKIGKNNTGELRDSENSFRHKGDAVIVSSELINKYRLVDGAFITGSVENGKLIKIDSIGGISPDEFKNRVPFRELIAIDPCERFDLSASGDKSMRIIDLIAPVGKGTRGMLVSPPKAGKTMILMQIAKAIRINSPDTRIVVFLIDERPEEVTAFKRSVEAEVIASSSDQSMDEHIKLAEFTLSHIRTELECGKDVVVLVDSLTRMGRAFNHKGSGTGRTLSGGMDSGALEIPRRFFGLARNIEDGGSVTIIATALIDTGSRMDELIFQEFKGTGNCEIVLNRDLAEKRIFPAMNIMESGTRKDELLYSEEDIQRLAMIRRAIAGRRPEDVMSIILEQMEKYPTNKELLSNISLN